MKFIQFTEEPSKNSVTLIKLLIILLDLRIILVKRLIQLKTYGRELKTLTDLELDLLKQEFLIYQKNVSVETYYRRDNKRKFIMGVF